MRNLLIFFGRSHEDFVKKITNKKNKRRSSWDILKEKFSWDLDESFRLKSFSSQNLREIFQRKSINFSSKLRSHEDIH